MKKLSTIFPMWENSLGREIYNSPPKIRKIFIAFVFVFLTGFAFGQIKEKSAVQRNSQSVQAKIKKMDRTDVPRKIDSKELIQREISYDNELIERLKAEKQNQTSTNNDLSQGKPIERRIESSETKGTVGNHSGAVNTENPPQSPFEAVKGKKEDLSKRDAFSKHYINEDGSYTALIGAGPIHYEKNGQFFDIDHKVVPNPNAAFPYANTANLFESYFGANAHNGVKSKTAEGEVLEFLNTKMFWEVNGQAVGVINSQNPAADIQENKVYYHQLFGQISAEYTVLTGKRELNYIIPNKQALSMAPANATYLVFSEDILLPTGWTATTTEKGIMVKDSHGKAIYLYENPVSKDAGEPLALSKEINTVYETHQIGQMLTVKTKVKTDWLLSSERVFPVLIDPTNNYYPNNENRWSVSVYDDGYEPATVGYFGLVRNGFSYRWLQYYVKFNTTSIPIGSSINSAIGYVNVYDRNGTSPWTRQWQFANSADPTVTYNVDLYNSAYLAFSPAANVTGSGWRNITLYNPQGNNYVKTGIDNLGYVALSVVPSGTYSTGNYYYIRPHTHDDRPYLRIDYTYDSNNPSYCATRTWSSPVDYLYIRDTRFLGTLNPTDVVNLNNGYANGYQNFTALWNVANRPTQAQGQGINIHAQLASRRGHFKAWVDWNKNGVFEEATELVYDTEEVATNAALFGFVIPQNQTPGDYRIRIRTYNRWIDYYDYFTGAYIGTEEDWDYDFNACEDFYPYYDGLYLVNGILAEGIAFEYGEAEDYLFRVIQDCPAKVTSVNVNPGDGERCGPGIVTISAQGPAGAIYNWYGSEFGGANLQTGPSNTFSTPNLPVGVYTYWVTVTSGGCESVARKPVTARVDPIPTIDIDASNPDICGDETSISITSSGDYEEVSLIDEKFNSGLGVFSIAGTAGYTDGNWINRPNPYQVNKPPYYVLRPAISSGYFEGNFAASITDLGQTQNLTKRLVLTNPVNATEIEGLKLEFLLYYQSYIGNDPANEYFDVEISTNNGTDWTLLERFTTTQGNPGRFVKKEYDLSAYDGMNNLKIRFTNYSWGSGGQNGGWRFNIAALDNIRLYGDRPLESDFSWSGADIDIYDSDCTTPYSGDTSEVCIKPSESQLENNTSWNLTATATLNNGCDASANIEITNSTKVWNPAGNATDWAATNQWKPAVPVPTADNCVIVKKTVQLNSGTGGLAKNLVVKNTGHLEINGGASLTVNDFIRNEATLNDFIVKHNGNLLQINGDTSINSGEITVEKDFKFSAERKQYNYVTAPVVSGRDMKTSIYTPNPTSVQVYNTGNDYFYETAGPYVSGLAYAVKESPGSGTATVAGKLMGVPFNGPLNYTLNTSGNKFNLLGNPYPSNLDIKALYDNNNTKIGSTFYFWDNTGNTLHEQQGSGYEGDHYAKFNASGNTGTAAQCTQYGSGCNKVPDQYVKTGTGFMIEAISGTLNFTNAYRTTAGSIDFFGKPAGFDNQYNRYWLTLTSPSGIQTMMAVVYFDGGTDEFSADDTEGSGGSNGLYSILDTKKLNIQGRAPFRIEDQVPLGYKSFEAGTYIIEVYNSDGIFAASQNIYLIDKLLNKTVKITDKPYKFLTRAGQFNDRFVIVYRPGNIIGTAAEISNQILFAKIDNQIVITSTIDKITEVELFNLNSRSVYKKSDVNSNELRIDALNFNHQIVVVTVKTETGEFVTRKFVNN